MWERLVFGVSVARLLLFSDRGWRCFGGRGWGDERKKGDGVEGGVEERASGRGNMGRREVELEV